MGKLLYHACDYRTTLAVFITQPCGKWNIAARKGGHRTGQKPSQNWVLFTIPPENPRHPKIARPNTPLQARQLNMASAASYVIRPVKGVCDPGPERDFALTNRYS